jgi:hypothetical protein
VPPRDGDPAVGPTLRVFHCRPARAAFDQVLREVLLPDLWREPGVQLVLAGRRGTDDTGERVVASVWTSLSSMRDAMGDDVERSRFHPEHLGETTDRRVEVLPVLRAVGKSDASSGILRIARGRLRSTELQDYAADLHEGVLRDREQGHGPEALILARLGPRAFLTLSTWPDWARIARATGATVHDPVHTQREHELAAFEAEHFELVPTFSAP